MKLQLEDIDPIIQAALREDMPSGDVTSESLLSVDSVSEAIIIAKAAGVLAGIDVARRVFEKIDVSVSFQKKAEDGQAFKPKDVLARLLGPSISLLKGERTALNFLQRLSGIATATRRFADAVGGTRTKILDTRKTTPALRLLEKYAVKMGGGENHRFSLSDMVLIKDNHLRIVGDIAEAVRRAKEHAPRGMKVEVEVTTLAEAEEALEAGASMIMLDNMSLRQMRRAVVWISGRVPIEVSGKVTIRRARQVAALGVDYISVGSLTHSYKSVDISMEFMD